MKQLLPLLFLLPVLATTPPSEAATLSLADALAKRAAVSRTLKMASLDEKIAGDAVQASRSGYLPRVDVQGGYTAQQSPQSITLTQGSYETQQADFAFVSASLYQTLYDFGRTDSRYERAQFAHDATALNYKIQEQDLFLRTVTAYFRVLREQKFLQTADEEVTQLTDHLRVARNFFEQGVVTRNDLLQAEVRLAGGRQRRLEVANRLDNAWLTLNDQIGEAPDSRADLIEETLADTYDRNRPVADVVASRAEIKAQEKTVATTGLESQEARTGYYPELFARLGLDYVQNDKVKEQAIYSATVGLKVNLFDGFATTSRYRQAVKNRSRSEERLRQLESNLALEYRIAVNDAAVSRQRISVTEAAIGLAVENLRINRNRYLEKVGTATEVLDAQTLLTQTRTDHFTALYDYQVAVARVKRAQGEL